MRVIETVEEMARTLDKERASGRQVGLVPTMGALHAGHLSLVERARAECDLVAVTVFVNPLQFDVDADLETYPRDDAGDAEKASGAGVDLVFAPSVGEMYPAPVLTSVRVSRLSEGLEGAHRPGHFEGVATVVTKLLAMAGRCRAYFGEKDYQQLLVVRRLVADLSFPVEVVGCETVRDHDGLALSSRNARLSEAERVAAPVLYRSLEAGRRAVESGRRDPAQVTALMADMVRAEPLARLDYAAAVDAADLTSPDPLPVDVRLLLAARVGTTRLIDNIGALAP